MLLHVDLAVRTANWSELELEPKPHHHGAFVPALDDTLYPGNFVVYKRYRGVRGTGLQNQELPADFDDWKVGRVIEIKKGESHHSLLLNIYKTFANVRTLFPFVTVRPFVDGNCGLVTEMLKTDQYTSLAVWATNEDLADAHKENPANLFRLEIAFVFPPKTIDDGHVDVGGMFNGFVCRYKVTSTGVVTDHTPDLHFPNRLVQEGNNLWYPFMSTTVGLDEKIHAAISLLQENMRKTLSSSSQLQGLFCKKATKIQLELPAWEYLLRCFLLNVHPTPVKVESSRGVLSTSIVGVGGRYSTVRIPRNIQKIHIGGQSALVLLRSVLGCTCTFGLRSRRPKIGHPQFPDENMGINVIAPGRGEDDTAETENDRETACGVVLRYIQSPLRSNHVHISVRYIRYLHNGTDNCPCDSLLSILGHEVATVPAEAAVGIKEGDFFQTEEDLEVMKVVSVSIDDDSVTATFFTNRTQRRGQTAIVSPIETVRKLIHSFATGIEN